MGDDSAARIEALELRVSKLSAELRQAEIDLRQARIHAAPHKVGDVVEAQFYGDETWNPVLVRAVVPKYGRVEYVVSSRKKDGDWARTERHPRRVRAVQS